jgi:hypothetical protein
VVQQTKLSSFVLGLLNDTVCGSVRIPSNDRLMANRLKWMWLA